MLGFFCTFLIATFDTASLHNNYYDHGQYWYFWLRVKARLPKVSINLVTHYTDFKSYGLSIIPKLCEYQTFLDARQAKQPNSNEKEDFWGLIFKLLLP